MNWVLIAGLFCVLSLCSFALTKALAVYLRRARMLDLPNDRSSHATPTPRGGGLAVLAVLGAGLVIGAGAGVLPVGLALQGGLITAFLAALSWLDDLRGLSPLVRFGSHIAAVAAALASGLVSGPFLPPLWGLSLPPVAEVFLIGLGWVWFINLFNFMDGIDGIAATETLAIMLGGAGLLLVSDGDNAVALIGLLVAAAVLGFLPLNWHPAKIFLGDVGSIPLGFLCAWMLLALAAEGMAAAAVILSLVFFADATLTLLKRLLRREKIWQAHRQHYYQKAVQRGLTHAQTSTAAGLANIVLVGLACWSISGPAAIALVAAIGVVVLLFAFYLKFPVAGLPGTPSP